MTPKANGISYARYIEAGWTDEQLIDKEYMVPTPLVTAPVVTMAAAPTPPATQKPMPSTNPRDYLADPDSPMDAAQTFLDKYYRAAGGVNADPEIHHWQSTFMVYESGIYGELTDDAINSKVWNAFHAEIAALKSKQVSEIIKALKAQTYLPEKTPVPCWLDAPTAELPDLLICKNGAFDLAKDVRHAPSPKLFATIRLPVDYAPEAPPPVEWLRFLKSLWPGDQESIDTLQEMFGLLLTPETKFQKIFLLVGPKRSGKGTILRTLRKLLGNDNVAGPALSTLANQYGMQCLIGKLAALIGDARINARSSEMSVVVERLLSISGEDSPNVERKYLPDWTGRLPTRIVMSSNELPHLDDPSGAMASRFVILTLRESFIGREDLDLESKLAPEMSGILNWAIEGRRRLLKRGRFVQPASGAASVEQMAELSSTVAKFLRECCNIGPQYQVPKDELYRAWQTWCATNGEKPTHSGLFGRDLIAAEPNIKSVKSRIGDERVRMYGGVALANTPSVAFASTVQEAPSFMEGFKVGELFCKAAVGRSLPGVK